MGASVKRRAPRRAVKAAAGDLPRYRVPQHWQRQLGGTMRQQLEHLRVEVERNTMAAALPGKGLSHTDRLVLVVLRQAGRPLRPREIEQKMEAGKASVNVSLQRLEHCRMAVRNALPCPRNTKAFEWSAVL